MRSRHRRLSPIDFELSSREVGSPRHLSLLAREASLGVGIPQASASRLLKSSRECNDTMSMAELGEVETDAASLYVYGTYTCLPAQRASATINDVLNSPLGIERYTLMLLADLYSGKDSNVS